MKYTTIGETIYDVTESTDAAAAALFELGEAEAEVWYAPQTDLDSAEAAGYEGAYKLASKVFAAPDALATAVVTKAKEAAASFAQEFPGEALDGEGGDWDAEAWGVDRADLAVPADRYESAWELYSRTLYAETERLASL